MLSLIRDKLKTWVVVVLVILVAIPLVFLGVGDYGSNQEQYALKVNDQEISKSVVLQEMGPVSYTHLTLPTTPYV